MKTKKQKIIIKTRTLFSPNLRSDVHSFKLLGGCRCGPFSNYWGGYSQIIGGYIPPPPLVSAPLVICMCVLGKRAQQKYLGRKLTKVQGLACLMISSAFPDTPTGGLEILLNITPIEEFLLAEAVRGSYGITVGGVWLVNRVGSFAKTKSHVDVCYEVTSAANASGPNKENGGIREKYQMPNYGKKNAISSESVLNQNSVKIYTNSS